MSYEELQEGHAKAKSKELSIFHSNHYTATHAQGSLRPRELVAVRPHTLVAVTVALVSSLELWRALS